MTGLDLKIERTRARIKAQDIAAAMGISPGRLSRIENGRAQITERMRERYLNALDRCRRVA